MTMKHKDWIIQTSKISDMFTAYFKLVQQNELIPGIPKGMPLNQSAIDKCALSFLTTNCGELNYSVTNDTNLNNDIMDMFARTFVRHFWNNRIAYDDEFAFWIKLRAFLDENMPVWEQFYKDAIIDKQSMLNNVSKITINNNGQIDIDTKNNNKGNVDSTSESRNHETSKGTIVNSNDGSVTSITDSNGKTSSQGRNKELNANADTPQDQLGSGIGNNGNDDPLKDYDFNYASSVNGINGYNGQNSTTVNHSDESNINNGRANTINNVETYGKVNTTDNTKSKSEDEGESHQTSTSNVGQNNESRNQSLFVLAEQMNNLANGAYANLFLKMKQEDLFLGTYSLDN